MRPKDLLVLVPSRGRPNSIRRMAQAWVDTNAFDVADLTVLIDCDDPDYRRYFALQLPGLSGACVRYHDVLLWRPMVYKLNESAVFAAHNSGYFALAFMGDDHVPLTPGWAHRYLEELRRLGTGIVYGDDLLQGEKLPTQWAMTSDIVRELGAMVPAPVQHLYCDNAILDLGRAADCISYLSDVQIEHRHPVANKAPVDDQYRRVNSAEQYSQDGMAYAAWRARRLREDAAKIKQLRSGHG